MSKLKIHLNPWIFDFFIFIFMVFVDKISKKW